MAPSSRFAALAALAGRRPEWTRTVRFRLTVTYSLLLFGLAALVVGGIYLGLSRSLDAQPVAKTFEVDKAAARLTADRLARTRRNVPPDHRNRRVGSIRC
jgi:hypothetical protein